MTRGPFVSRALLFFLTLLLGAAILPDSANAQYFGRNKVQYKTFDTEVLQTEHFDIYYYPEWRASSGRRAAWRSAGTRVSAVCWIMSSRVARR